MNVWVQNYSGTYDQQMFCSGHIPFFMNPSPTSMFTCTKAISGVAGPRPVLLRPGEAHQATGVKAATA